MLISRIKYLLFFCCITTTLSGQHYNFKEYNVSEGLSQSQVYAICEDQRGYIWFGTRGGGISIFDGIKFENISQKDGLADDFINTIFEDSQGKIWVGTNSGLSCFTGNKIKNYSTKNGLKMNAIYDICEQDDGVIYFSGYKGIMKFENNTFEFLPIQTKNRDENFYGITTIDGELWLASDNGLYHWNGIKSKNYRNINRIHNNKMRDVVIWRNKVVTGSYGGGISIKKNQRFINLSKSNGMPHYIVLCLFEDDEKRLWIGTEGGGVIRYDGVDFKQFTIKDGLTSNSVHAILQDSQGKMWFGTSGGGVNMLDGEVFVHYDKRDGLVGSGVYSIAQDTSGNIWVGTKGGGVTLYDQNIGVVERYTKIDGFTDAKVKAIFCDTTGEVWLGTEGSGVFRFSNNTFEQFKFTGRSDQISANWIKKIDKDQDGRLWFATSGGGICFWNGQVFKKFLKRNGLSSDRINDFEIHKNRMWLATDNGITIMDSSKIQKITSKNGLPKGKVKSVEVDKHGTFWVGITGEGVCSIHDGNIKNYNVSNGLSSNNIYLLKYDSYGYLWSGSEKGLDKITLNERGEVVNIRHYGKAQGFIGMETCQNASFQDTTGNIWFGTVKSLTKYNPARDQYISVEPKLHITNIRLPYIPIKQVIKDLKYQKWVNLPIDLTLNHKQNHITFEFIGINHQNPLNVKYQWKLEGFETSWSPIEKQQQVTYSNLPPGQYTFLVKSCNDDGIWNEKPVAYTFSIDSAPPPFYLTFWFILSTTSIIILILCLVGYIIWFRVKNRNEELKMEKNLLTLEQKALRLQMNPHFLFNCLNSIKGYISENKSREAKLYLSKFAKLMRNILDNSRAAYITLESERQTLQNYMELEKISHPDLFEYEIEISEEIDADLMSIPPMIIQPFVENAILHGVVPKGSEGFIYISFRIENEKVLCVVDDNGVGRKQSNDQKAKSVTDHESAAISITEQRLNILHENAENENLNITFIDKVAENGKAKGTKVEILMPLIEK